MEQPVSQPARTQFDQHTGVRKMGMLCVNFGMTAQSQLY